MPVSKSLAFSGRAVRSRQTAPLSPQLQATIVIVFFAACLCTVLGAVALGSAEKSTLAKSWIDSQLANYRSSDQGVRAQASLALVNTGKAAVPELIATLSDGDPVVRRLAVETLGALGERARSAEGALVAMLADREEQVQVAAARALSSLHSRAAMNGLVKASTNGNPQVRAAAVIGLALYDGPAPSRAIAPLKRAAQSDGDLEVRSLANASLQFIKDKQSAGIAFR